MYAYLRARACVLDHGGGRHVFVHLVGALCLPGFRVPERIGLRLSVDLERFVLENSSESGVHERLLVVVEV